MTAPGWYPDPSSADDVRYWDGSRWTDEVAPAAQFASPPAATSAVGDDPPPLGAPVQIAAPEVGPFEPAGPRPLPPQPDRPFAPPPTPAGGPAFVPTVPPPAPAPPVPATTAAGVPPAPPVAPVAPVAPVVPVVPVAPGPPRYRSYGVADDRPLVASPSAAGAWAAALLGMSAALPMFYGLSALLLAGMIGRLSRFGNDFGSPARSVGFLGFLALAYGAAELAAAVGVGLRRSWGFVLGILTQAVAIVLVLYAVFSSFGETGGKLIAAVVLCLLPAVTVVLLLRSGTT